MSSTPAVDWSATSFAGHQLPDWFVNAPLGIFIHWGAYSVPAWAEPTGELGAVDPQEWFAHNPYAEWYLNTIQIEGSPAWQHHRDVHGGAPYDDFLDRWRAEQFDPADWAALFAHVGADYVVPTTKHHDGITLWDAPQTGARNTVHRGPRRDVVGAIAEAVRAAGLRFGVYYSGGLDWHVRPSASLPSAEGRPFPVPDDDEYGRYAAAQVQDLVDRYAPSVLWNDITWPAESQREGAGGLVELFEHYYATVPDGVVNDRWGPTHWDYRTSEYQAFRDLEDDTAWENCRGIGLSFGYNAVESESEYLDGPALARHLADCVSRGGRFLLNVGPMADGTIPPLQRTALTQLGDWRQTAKRHLVGAARIDAPSSDEPFVRWLGHSDRLVGVLDVPGERFARSQPEAEVTIEVPAAVTGISIVVGGQAELTGRQLTVRLAADRVGPALVVTEI